MSKPAYVVANARSSDPSRMARYRELATAAVERVGGRYLVRGGAYTVLEGNWHPERVVVIEFPSMEDARKFYDSPEYAAARAARQGVSDFDVVLVEGF